jgi:osmotically-inducible protein OsmY
MKTIRLILTASFIMTSLLTGQTTVPDDSDIEKGVAAVLLDFEPTSNLEAIVKVDDGIVTLSGQVDSLVVKNLAGEATGTVRGVRAIVNHLEVKEANRSDDVIDGDLARLFSLHHPEQSDVIQYRVNDGVVTLLGTVRSFSLKRVAEKTASMVRGVRSVLNDLRVEALNQPNDDEIRQQIALLLKINPLVKDQFVNISVHDGVADINGAVDSYEEKTRLISAVEVSGAHTINTDDLDVSPELRPKMERPHDPISLTDKELKQSLTDAYRQDSRLDGSGISIDIIDGNITLSGTVLSIGAKASAERTATNLPGANYMYSALTIAGPDWASDEVIEAALTVLYELDSESPSKKIKATVQNGVVTLSGMTDTVYQRRRAVQTAADMVGVEQVVNKLRVDWDSRKKEITQSEGN